MLFNYVDRKPQVFFHTDLDRRNLEKRLSQHDPHIADLDEFNQFLLSKQKSLRAAALNQLRLIEKREELNLHLMQDIDLQISQLSCDLGHLERLDRSASYLGTNHISPIIQTKHQILELKREKRQEYLMCFNDLKVMQVYFLRTISELFELNNRLRLHLAPDNVK